jgi:hypothetical protein
MKKVIIGKKSVEVYLEDLNPADIIGIETTLGSRFFLSKTALGVEWIGESNIASSVKPQYEYFTDSFNSVPNVFVFETYKELFKWLQGCQ